MVTLKKDSCIFISQFSVAPKTPELSYSVDFLWPWGFMGQTSALTALTLRLFAMSQTATPIYVNGDLPEDVTVTSVCLISFGLKKPSKIQQKASDHIQSTECSKFMLSGCN